MNKQQIDNTKDPVEYENELNSTYNEMFKGAFNGAGLTLIHGDKEDNFYILYAKSNSAVEYKKNIWIFAGGKRDNDETPIQTAYREFVEEIFNVIVDNTIINEIIECIQSRSDLYPIETILPLRISSNVKIPSFTFLQSSKSITIFIDVLNKHNIRSDVFPFGYNGLYNNKKEVNIFNFCSQRRYITEPCLHNKNELVFITMIPISNLLDTIYSELNINNKNIYHYHMEYLKIFVPSEVEKINDFIKMNLNIVK